MENRNDFSTVRTEGTEAGDNMRTVTVSAERAASETRAFEQPASERASGNDLLSTLASVHKRLDDVEADNAGMRDEIERAKNRDGLDIDPAQLRHVLMKYFPHDFPEPETVVIAQQPRFDAFTGRPLNS